MGVLPGPLQHALVVLILREGFNNRTVPSSPLHGNAMYCSTTYCGALLRRKKRGKGSFWNVRKMWTRGIAVPQNSFFRSLWKLLLRRESMQLNIMHRSNKTCLRENP